MNKYNRTLVLATSAITALGSPRPDDDVRDLAGRHEWNADDGSPRNWKHHLLSRRSPR